MVPRALLGMALACCAAACSREPVGVFIHVRLGDLQYDELQFGVTLMEPVDGAAPGSAVLVDPKGRGQYVAPFPPGDQDVFVYLDHSVVNRRIRCESMALLAGSLVGADHADTVVESGFVQEVYLDLVEGRGVGVPAADAGAGVDAPPSDPGPGDAGAETAGPLPPGDRVLGAPCSDKTECKSDHCADGVCCDADCDKECQSCVRGGLRGICGSVPAGTPDPRGKCEDKGVATCQTNGLCDVVGRCASYPFGAICAPATCEKNGEVALSSRTCNGSGKCLDATKRECSSPLSCSDGACR